MEDTFNWVELLSRRCFEKSGIIEMRQAGPFGFTHLSDTSQMNYFVPLFVLMAEIIQLHLFERGPVRKVATKK